MERHRDFLSVLVLTSAAVSALCSVGLAQAQEGQWAQERTSAGCLFFQDALRESIDNTTITWSEPCVPGRLISGYGTLIYEGFSGGTNTRQTWTGQLVAGHWHGRLSVASQVVGEPIYPEDTMQPEYNMGCPVFEPACVPAVVDMAAMEEMAGSGSPGHSVGSPPAARPRPVPGDRPSFAPAEGQGSAQVFGSPAAEPRGSGTRRDQGPDGGQGQSAMGLLSGGLFTPMATLAPAPAAPRDGGGKPPPVASPAGEACLEERSAVPAIVSNYFEHRITLENLCARPITVTITEQPDNRPVGRSYARTLQPNRTETFTCLQARPNTDAAGMAGCAGFQGWEYRND